MQSVNQVVEGALTYPRSRFDALYHDMMWIDRTRESEYDGRRLLANEGIAALENALTSVGDRRETHEFSSPGHGSLSHFNDVKEFKADTDEEAIVGMQQLIQGRIDTERKKWETISAMKTSDGTPLLHVRGPQFREFRWRYNDALEEQYGWQMRQEGFNLGLQALGLEINNETGTVLATGNQMPTTDMVAYVNQLPNEKEFLASLLPQANQPGQ